MATVTKFIVTGTIPANELHRLHAEVRSKAGTLGAYCERVRIERDSPNDSLIFDFDVAPIDAALDALIAAYPSTAAVSISPVAISINVSYLLADEPIGIGQQVIFDYHLLAAFGTAVSSQPQLVRGSLLAWRDTTGDVKVNLSAENTLGVIPSFRVIAIGTARTAQLSIRMGKAGTLTIGVFKMDRVLEMQL